MMTVADLIARLQELPGDLPVLMEERHGKFLTPVDAMPIKAFYEDEELWWGVRHQFDPWDADPDETVFPAVMITQRHDERDQATAAIINHITGNRADTLPDAPGQGDK